VRLLPRASGRRVLVFHRVVDRPERDHDLSWTAFRGLLDRLQEAGSTFAHDLDAAPTDGSVVLTFDDTSSDHLAVGRELAKRGVPAIFFASTGHLGTEGHLDPDSLPELVAGGHTIGSHGWSHRRLDRMTEVELVQEVETSRARLEDLIGLPVNLFAPAGGVPDRALSQRLRAAGYVASRSTRWGIHRRLDDRWQIPAIPVTHIGVNRGWVHSAATKGRLPLAMVALREARRVLSPDMRTALRKRFHGPPVASVVLSLTTDFFNGSPLG
jgi:peptidoglycan/xylan/chitin deacetylase (PgdA/CDA1 family)